MRNYSIYTLKTKPEFTNLYQYLNEKDYKKLEPSKEIDIVVFNKPSREKIFSEELSIETLLLIIEINSEKHIDFPKS